MISQSRLQVFGSHSQSPIGCNLCGTNGASVRCDKCQSMAFCLSCDDMYHRHPKRRYHLRKAVALDMTHNNLTAINMQTSNSISTRPPIAVSINSGHPSKMPIPPPRRKRKGITLSSIKDTFANTGNMFRRFVGHDKSVIQSAKCDAQQFISPIIAKSMQKITPESNQNQTRVITNHSFRPLPPTPKYEDQIPPPPPPKQIPQIYENYRKASLPMNSYGRMSFSGKTSSSIGDISMEPELSQRFMSPTLPPKMKSNTLERKNCSLHDLSVSQTMDSISSPTYPPVCPHFMPNSQYYLHPWGTSSLTNSIEDLQLNDNVQDYDSDDNLENRRAFANRQPNNRLKKSNMKRCQSAFQMFPVSPMPSPIPQGPPFLYYYYPTPYCPPPSSPSQSIRSKSININRRPSFDNGSTASSSRDQRFSSKFNRKNKPKVPEYVGSGKDLSDSGGRSITSSSRQQSDFEDEEDFFSVSNDGSSQDEDNRIGGQWACRFCTFVNDMNTNICEICSKTRRNIKKTLGNTKTYNEKLGHRFKKNTSMEIESNKNNKEVKEVKEVNDVVFNEKLIKEQKEIEKELIRRLENERKFDKQNEKIMRKEEFIRKKSLGLRIDEDLIDQIKTDENEINKFDDSVKNESILKNNEESENKCIDNFDSKSRVFEKIEKGMNTEPEEIVSSTSDRQPILETLQNNILTQNSSFVPISSMTPKTNSTTTSAQNCSTSTNSLSSMGQFMQNIDYQNPAFNTNQNANINTVSYNNQSNNQILGSHPLNQFHNQMLESQQFASLPVIQNNVSQVAQSSFGSEYVFGAHQMNQQNQMIRNNIRPIPQMPQMPQVPQMPQLPQMSPYYSQVTGLQTPLDQFTNNCNYDQNIIKSNPLPQQQMYDISNGTFRNRFGSCEDLQSLNSVNDKIRQKSQLESGLHLIKLLREAEKSGFTADDVEVALNYSPNNPLEWLEENWNNMVETVMTLANNQNMQNEKKKGTKKLLHLNLITEKEAKVSLRLSKGNIWQAIEKCVKRKEEDKLFGDTKSSFSLKISGLGSGKDNEDSNFVDANDVFVDSDDDLNHIKQDQLLQDISIKSQIKAKSATDLVNIDETDLQKNIQFQSSFHRVTSSENFQLKRFFEQNDTEYDNDSQIIDQLVMHWKNEKEITDRENNKLRQQEKQKQKLRKILELQKKFSEFDSEDSEEEEEEDLNLEVAQTLANQLEDEQKVWTNIDDGEEEINLKDKFFNEEADNDWDVFYHEEYNEETIKYVNRDREQQIFEDQIIPNKQQNYILDNSDHEEYYSNDQSDSNDEFEAINQRMQHKINGLTAKFDFKKDLKSVDNNEKKIENCFDKQNQMDLKSYDCSNRLEKTKQVKQELEEELKQELGTNMSQQINEPIINAIHGTHGKLIQKPNLIDMERNTDQQKLQPQSECEPHNNSIHCNQVKSKQPNIDEETVIPQSYLLPKKDGENDSDEDRKQYYKMMKESEKESEKESQTLINSQINANKKCNQIDSHSDQLNASAQQILREIDQTLKQSLEDLKLMEEEEREDSNEGTEKIVSFKTDSIAKGSHSSLQLPVFGKQKGSDKLRKALICDTESNNSNQIYNNNNNSKQDSCQINNELHLKMATVSQIDIDWDVLNEESKNCSKTGTKDAIIKKFESIENDFIDANEQNSKQHTIKNNAKQFESQYEKINQELSDNLLVSHSSSNQQIISNKEFIEPIVEQTQNIDHQKNCCPLKSDCTGNKVCDSDIKQLSKEPKFNQMGVISETKNNITEKSYAQEFVTEKQFQVINQKLDILKEEPKNAKQPKEKLDQLDEPKINNIPLRTRKSSNSSETNRLSIDLQIKSNSKMEEKTDRRGSLTNSLILIEKIRESEYSENFGWARTQYECEICASDHSINDIVAMISCIHFACKDCLQQYFTVQIRERQRLVIACPFCEEPNIDPDDDDKVFEYLGLLDQLIRYLVSSDVHELFQRKVRDRALMRDPNFRWCTQCSSGFIAPNPQAKTVMCPDCKSLTCAKCRKTWKKQHFNISCEQFAEWEKAMDPEYAEQQLDKHLKEFGIDCPNCKFKYQLAKGGCMHFRCIQCSYDFCGGCQRPFKMGNRCGVSPFCEKLGLHSHHPRNCLFYLRDKETNELQLLLDKQNIEYKTKLDSQQKSTRCPVMEQKDTDSGMKDESCGRYIESAGLCRLHYKEYLGDLIWKNGIDPINIFNEDELELVLKRENIRLPPKLNKEDKEYQQKLINMIEERVPLNPNDE